MNEAALLAARHKATVVALSDFEAAIERVIAGSEKKSRVMNEQERTTVAYHESGHALVAEQYERGQALLRNHPAALSTLAQQLLKHETVNGSDVKEALGNSLSPESRADAAQLQSDAKR